MARGAPAFIEVSGRPGEILGVVFGTARLTGLPTPVGRLNLDLAQPIFTIVNGFSGNPLGVLDRFGETRISVDLPAALTPRLRFALQAFVTSGARTIASNPHEVVLQ